MFKEGDWVLRDFTIVQIKKIEKDWITVSDGSFETSGRLELRELTLRDNEISAHFQSVRDELHREYGRAGLNFPDIHRWMVGKWLETIDDSDAMVRTHLDELYKFRDGIRDAVLGLPRIDGIKVLNA